MSPVLVECVKKRFGLARFGSTESDVHVLYIYIYHIICIHYLDHDLTYLVTPVSVTNITNARYTPWGERIRPQHDAGYAPRTLFSRGETRMCRISPGEKFACVTFPPGRNSPYIYIYAYITSIMT